MREKHIEAGREPILCPRGVELSSGDRSEGGDGVSGEGVCHRGGLWAGVKLSETDLLLSFAESWFLGPPKVDINESTGVNARES